MYVFFCIFKLSNSLVRFLIFDLLGRTRLQYLVHFRNPRSIRILPFEKGLLQVTPERHRFGNSKIYYFLHKSMEGQ